MYKRILVPIDGSRTSNLGLNHALRLARDQRARLKLVHVLDEFVIAQNIDMAGMSAELLDAFEKGGKAVVKNAKALAARHGIRAESALCRTMGGRASDAIVAEAKKWKADLIVIGTHGRRGVRRMVLGSDAEAVARAAPVPVLLVRPGGSERRSR